MSVTPDLKDPQHDPTAAYALEPAFTRALTRLVKASSGEEHHTHSPADGAPLAAIPLSSTDDVAAALKRAAAAQSTWASTPVADRARALMRFYDLVMERREEITDVVVLESG